MSQIEGSKKKKSYWRSFGELVKSKTFNKFLHREFQEGASELSDPSRRSFMKLMGASAALAGVSGCGLRKPVQTIRPYVKMPENLIPGKANYYATTMNVGPDVTGLLVESHEGRPTKIEGNPLHDSSLGTTSVFHQASILDLYDPDRLKHSMKNGSVKSRDRIVEYFNELGADYRKKRGSGLSILTQSEMSPTFYRLLSVVNKVFPKAKVFRYDPVNFDNQTEGLMLATGKRIVPMYDFEKADIVVSFDSDFIGNEVNRLSNEKGFSARRDPDHRDGMNRLYVFENNYSVTGAKADHRIRLKSGDVEGVSYLVAWELLKRADVSSAISQKLLLEIKTQANNYKGLVKKKVINAIVDDIMKNIGSSLFVAGIKQSPSVHATVAILNQVFKNVSKTVNYTEIPFSDFDLNKKTSFNSFDKLVQNIDDGEVQALLILGGNPRFDAPSDLNFGPKLKKVKQSLHLTVSENETSELCDWVVPMSHYLESWGDATSLAGVSSIVQPLISPMYDSFTSIEVLTYLLGYRSSGYANVRKTWRAKDKSIDFNAAWKKWLHTGVISRKPNLINGKVVNSAGIQKLVSSHKPRLNEEIELVFNVDYSVFDGRFINNGWLQECPDPITKLTWDNAALVSPKTAKRLGLPALKGVKDIETAFQNPLDVMTIKVGPRSLETVFLVVPGHADDSISVFLGYGRKNVGRVGHDTGFNTYYLRSSNMPWVVPAVTVSSTNKTYELATTQEHGSMEGRPLVAEATLTEYKEHPNFAQEMEHFPPMESLWEEHKYDKGYQWGMSIDLSKCSGCNACVIGCQSENNIPIVGKKEVLNGREMHWIRLDRYFEGEKGEEDPRVVQQPMTCLQCENAPCEQVCPVAATTHSEDGLNQMTYNRCIGTRYCSNNCPVKVRRFNFFDYHQRNPQSVKKDRKHLFDYVKEPDPSIQKQFNPDVTVRMRGVMEKCTFCVQRIKKAKVDAKLEDRQIRDGEIQPACSQACSADAIVFGNINDPESRVSKLKKKQRDYQILKGLHLKARLSYIAAITNPHPLLEVKKSGYKSHKEAH